MKLAVVSDIHGNRPALEAVLAQVERWQPDLTLVNGDVVNRGPNSRLCWESIQTRVTHQGWHYTLGNHEEYVLSWERETPRTAIEKEIHQSSFWTYTQLQGRLAELKQMSTHFTCYAPDGSELRATHASMRHNRDGIMPGAPQEEIQQQIAPAPDVFVTSHTHRFFVRQVGGCQVVNSGSVGCPLDGNPQAGYAQIVWQKGTWRTTLVRLPYDRDQADRDFHTSGYLRQGGAMAALLYQEWKWARSFIPHWSRQYEAAVLAGALSLAASVQRYLESVGIAVQPDWLIGEPA